MRIFFLLLLTGLTGSSAWVKAQVPKTILVEKITSVGCPGCPWGGYLLDSFAQNDPNIIPVAIHLNDQWHPDLMATPDGDSIIATYWWAQPTAMVDRIKFDDQTSMAFSTVFWKDKIAERATEPTPILLGASTSYNAITRDLTVDLSGLVRWDMTGDLRVNAYVIEETVTGSGLGYDQLNGYDQVAGNPLFGLGNPILNYSHKFVLRDMLGGPWGTAGVIPAAAPANTTFSHSYTITLDSSWDDTDLRVVVLAQRFNSDIEQRPILSAISLGTQETVLTDRDLPVSMASLAVYPNPFVDEMRIRMPENGADRYTLHDLTGRLVREVPTTGTLTLMERGQLRDGFYLLQAWQNGQSIAHCRILCR